MSDIDDIENIQLVRQFFEKINPNEIASYFDHLDSPLQKADVQLSLLANKQWQNTLVALAGPQGLVLKVHPQCRRVMEAFECAKF